MLKLAERSLSPATVKVLAQLQAHVDNAANYADRVARAGSEWKSKTGTSAKQAAFREVRSVLATACVGSIRCAYCEDSLADEIEHIRPKNLFPEVVFVWSNYLFSCGPCNGPKSNRYGVVTGNGVAEFKRRRNDAVVPPPAGQSGFVDPRTEDPLEFFELDMGGRTPEGVDIEGTFEILPSEGLTGLLTARSVFTIEVLGLNREAIRAARENAFGGFRARMKEYVAEKEAGANNQRLDRLKMDLLSTPHLTVFAEILRQRAWLPELNDLLDRAPEMLAWSLVPEAA